RERWEPVMDRLLSLIGEGSLPGTKRRCWAALARKLAVRSTSTEPWRVGNVLVFSIDARNPQAVAKPDGADLGIIWIRDLEKRLGPIEVPLLGDFSIRDQMRLTSEWLGLKAPNWPKRRDAWARFSSTALNAAFRRKRAFARAALRGNRRRERLRVLL